MAAVAAISGLPFDPAWDEPLELERFTRWSIDGAGRRRADSVLVVEGKVEANLTDIKSVEITANGTFKGNAEVESAVIAGVYPPLAALEMLLYPKSATVIANNALAQIGNIEIIPPEAPMTLFVWGPEDLGADVPPRRYQEALYTRHLPCPIPCRCQTAP